MITHVGWLARVLFVSRYMSDGKVRELNDVRYIPQMKKNLISVGALELEGLKKILRRRSHDV